MQSLLHRHIARETRVATRPDADALALAQIFAAQVKGRRLRGEDMERVLSGLTATAAQTPTTIFHRAALNDDSGQKGGARTVTAFHYYLAPATAAAKLAKQERVNPYAHALYAACKHIEVGAKSTAVTIRNLPVALQNEQFETAYLKHTGKEAVHGSDEMRHAVNFALLLAQTYGNVRDSMPPWTNDKAYIPFGQGLMTGNIHPLEMETRQHRIVAGKTSLVHLPQAGEQPGHMVEIDGYLPYSHFSNAQEALFLKLRHDFFMDPAALQLLAENADFYGTNRTTIPEDDPHRDLIETLRIDMMEVLGGPYWQDVVSRASMRHPFIQGAQLSQ